MPIDLEREVKKMQDYTDDLFSVLNKIRTAKESVYALSDTCIEKIRSEILLQRDVTNELWRILYTKNIEAKNFLKGIDFSGIDVKKYDVPYNSEQNNPEEDEY